MLQPLLIVCLTKAWSDEARAAAQAARAAKREGADPKEAAEAAKQAVRDGSSVKDAVKQGVDAAGGSSGAEGKASFKQISDFDFVNAGDPDKGVSHYFNAYPDGKSIITGERNGDKINEEEWAGKGKNLKLVHSDGEDTGSKSLSARLGMKVGDSISRDEWMAAANAHHAAGVKGGDKPDKAPKAPKEDYQEEKHGDMVQRGFNKLFGKTEIVENGGSWYLGTGEKGTSAQVKEAKALVADLKAKGVQHIKVSNTTENGLEIIHDRYKYFEKG